MGSFLGKQIQRAVRNVATKTAASAKAFIGAPTTPTTPATPAPLQFDNPERAGRIEASLGRAAFGPDRIREILEELKAMNYLAGGGIAKVKTNGISFEEWLKGKQKYDMEELYNDYLEDLKQKEFEKKYPRNEAADGGLISMFREKR